MIIFSLTSLIMHICWKKEIMIYLQKIIYKQETRKAIYLKYLNKAYIFPLKQIS